MAKANRRNSQDQAALRISNPSQNKPVGLRFQVVWLTLTIMGEARFAIMSKTCILAGHMASCDERHEPKAYYCIGQLRGQVMGTGSPD